MNQNLQNIPTIRKLLRRKQKRINPGWVNLVPRSFLLPVSLSLAPQGRVGENRKNEVVGELDRNFYSVVGKILKCSLKDIEQLTFERNLWTTWLPDGKRNVLERFDTKPASRKVPFMNSYQ